MSEAYGERHETDLSLVLPPLCHPFFPDALDVVYGEKEPAAAAAAAAAASDAVESDDAAAERGTSPLDRWE